MYQIYYYNNIHTNYSAHVLYNDLYNVHFNNISWCLASNELTR